MDIQFASRMQDFEEGIFQVLNEKKQELERQGKPIYNLSIGTPDFPPAPHIMEAVQSAAQKPENYKYSITELPELIEAVKMRFRSRYGVELQEEEITSVYGTQEGMAHIGLTLCDSGDAVLVPNPGYPVFTAGPSLAGAEVIPYELREENHYLPDLDGLSDELLKRVKLMIISYPLNPIAKAAPRSFYEKLIAWAKEKEILILHDNAYSDIIYDGREGISILSIEGAKEVCAEFYSLSKSYNYTGARSSFLAGNKEVVQHLKRLRSQIDYGTFLPVQYGAIAALTGDDACVKAQCAEYEKRRNILCSGLRELGWDVPDSEGTMFVWAKTPKGYEDDTQFVMKLMEQSGVIATPGSSFGSLGAGHIRFALTLPADKLKEAVESIKASKILSHRK